MSHQQKKGKSDVLASENIIQGKHGGFIFENERVI